MLPRGSAGQAQGAPEIGSRQPWRNIPLTVLGGLYSDGNNIMLAPIDDGDVLANISGSQGTPVGVSLSDLLDHDISPNQGEIIYRTSTGWVGLDPGTSGFFLKTQGTAADVIWAPVSPSRSVGFYIGGLMTASEVLGAGIWSSNIQFTSSDASTLIKAQSPANVDSDLLFQEITVTVPPSAPVTVGTMHFAAGSITATMTWSPSPYTLTAGKVLQLVSPSPADPALALISGTIHAQ